MRDPRSYRESIRGASEGNGESALKQQQQCRGAIFKSCMISAAITCECTESSGVDRDDGTNVQTYCRPLSLGREMGNKTRRERRLSKSVVHGGIPGRNGQCHVVVGE